MKGNRPGRSVEIMPFNSSTEKTPEPTWWCLYIWLRGGGRGSSGSGLFIFIGLDVERVHCRVRCIRPMIVGIDGSRCFRIKLLLRLGQVKKNPLSMAWQNILTGGYPAVACRNVARLFLFFCW